MNAIDCITSRRSIRRFEDRLPSHEELEKAVSAAAYTPSWKNTQITRYIIIEDRKLITQIAEDCDFEFNKKTIANAPVLVAVTVIKNRCGYERDGSFSTNRGDSWQMFDAGAAAQTFCLAAHEYGLGTVIMGIFNQEKTEQLLKLDADRELVALIALGYPAESPEAPRRKTVTDLITYL